MTAIVEMPPKTLSQIAGNPRKRKKRTPAAGAAADCFKCAERHVSCDRRRPYCSQCLELGEDCSGYKTQLTWNIGVASRGKLRGQTLPVAGSAKTVAEDAGHKSKKRRDTNASEQQVISPTRIIFEDARPTVAMKTPTQDIEISRTPEITNPDVEGGSVIWDPTFFSAPHNSSPATENQERGALPQSQLNTRPADAHIAPHKTPSLVDEMWSQPQLATSNYLNSINASTQVDTPSSVVSRSYFESPGHFADSSTLVSPMQLSFPETRQIPLPPQYAQPFDGIGMLLEADERMHPSKSDMLESSGEDAEGGNYGECAVIDDYISTMALPAFDLDLPPVILSGTSNIGRTARMQYLINYYTEVISPVIVAFDSPNNPFRTQILRLAESSETLQHAISALAASNLRQRRGIGLLSTGKTAPARRSSFAHVHLSNEYAQSLLSPEEQIREETLHKRLAVAQLNQQLGHPVLRRSDAILATLLVLCLFHICDSGIAKFQTQFAGVRKLLSLRGDDVKIGSEDSRWMSRLFTWFDVLASTVNDRERQITGQLLDMSALGGDWALENLAGVDGRLFKAISKLARLNMLRQGKCVEQGDAFLPIPPPSPFSADAYAFLDGNGWVRHDDGDGLGISFTEPNNERLFWQEWHVVRQELLSWHLDTTLFDSSSRESSYLTFEQRADLENISQSFRYSALLYLERLAQPNLPSSDEAIQKWVRQSLSHIKQVVSDVYLLWPLFITGTECMDEDGRSVIRGRCADIQKDSGFVNNASCLQLLEKIWRANSPHSSPASEESIAGPLDGVDHNITNSFRFREVMVKEASRTEGEGEYIVI